MIHRLKRALVLSLLLGAALPAMAADPVPANRFAASIVPAERFEIGSLAVERHGKGGRTLILIPGLASGTWAWQETVRQLGGEHTLYLVTLPGFDGRAALAGPVLDTVRADLHKLIATRKLARPVLLGHSLGGTLALALAAEQPDSIGGVISIDGLPVFPGWEDFTPEQRRRMTANMAQRPGGSDPAAFARQQEQYMRTIGVLDMGRAADLAKLSGKSSPAAVGQYVGEVLASDLRPGLASIKAPVLVLCPYFEDDDSQHRMSEAMKLDYYRSLLAGTPRLQVLPVAPSRHFAMFDQPQLVHDAVRAFLKGL